MSQTTSVTCSAIQVLLRHFLILKISSDLPPVIVVLSDHNYEYFVLTYLTYFCMSKNMDYVVPITMLLMINVLLAVGTSLFIPMLWATHKVITS